MIRWVMLALLLVFYLLYYLKMYSLWKKGMRIDQMGKGNKNAKTRTVERLLKICTFILVPVQIVSITFSQNVSLGMDAVPPLLLCLGGVAVFVVALLSMQNNWRVGIPEEKTTLVTGRIFRFSRNPAFLGFDLLNWGVLAFCFHWSLAILTLMATVLFHLQILEEEGHLSQSFGKEYAEYRKKTSRYVSVNLVCILLGTSLIINELMLLFVTNFHWGGAAALAAGIFLLVFGIWGKKWRTQLRMCLILALFPMLFLWGYGIHDNATYQEDAAIVLGAGVFGEKVSPLLANRLDRAVLYAAQNPDAWIVVSGGQGPQEEITEALAMERYLVAKGVAPKRILKEEQSSTTAENLFYTKMVLENPLDSPYTVVLITTESHVFRATWLAKTEKLEATHLHANTAWYMLARSYFRECMAIVSTVFGYTGS